MASRHLSITGRCKGVLGGHKPRMSWSIQGKHCNDKNMKWFWWLKEMGTHPYGHMV